MIGQRVVVLGLLVASLFVLGTLSASLDATVTSSPDDAIDVDTDSLPFAGDGTSEIADSYRQAEDGEQEAAVGSSDAEDGSAGASSDVEGSNEGAGGDSPPSEARGATDGSGSAESGGASQGEESGQDGGEGPGEGLGESLWGLLAQYLVAILALLALLGLLVLARVLSHRRERLLARLRALADRLGLLPDEGATGAVAVPDGEGEAATVVERAWAEMLQASTAEPLPSDTPRECARQVIDGGVAAEPVEELTAMYEQVRYGDGSITADDASRALQRAREVTPGPTTVDGEQSAAGSTAAGGVREP